MRRRSDQVREIIRRVDPGRMRADRPLGLRDGAILALVAAGLSAREIATLRASEVTIIGGRVDVQFIRRGETLHSFVPGALGTRLLAWLTNRRLWGTEALVFTAFRGPVTPRGISAVLDRYRRNR